MDEDILKRRMLSNYCLFFLKEDLKEHIYYLRVQREFKKGENKMNTRDDKFFF